MRKKYWFLALVAGLTFLLSGCFVKTVDELYALPTHSDAYYDLQNAIDGVFASGSFRYSAPVDGVNRQSVQLADLDGDGVEEALAYLKGQGEAPLCVYIFDRIGDSFQNVAVIQGTGSAFLSVEYAQLDGQPGLELIVGRQLSDRSFGAMNAYTMAGSVPAETLSANYTEYALADLDSDGQQDLFILRQSPDQTPAAELYCCREGMMVLENEASLSVGAGKTRRINTGHLEGGVPAVFVASTYQAESLVTDVFALRDGSFQNISLNEEGVSAQTLRAQSIYACDIDGDGITELPQPQALPVPEGTGESAPIIRWYALELSGAPKGKDVTHHDLEKGWYVTLSEDLLQDLAILPAEGGGKGFYRLKNGEQTLMFAIYTAAGEGRSDLPAGRFLLAEQGDVRHTGQLFDTTLTQHDLTQMFHLIHTDWNSGER